MQCVTQLSGSLGINDLCEVGGGVPGSQRSGRREIGEESMQVRYVDVDVSLIMTSCFTTEPRGKMSEWLK